MIEPVGMTTEEWAKRYEISLDPRPCAGCGIDLYPTIPFAEADWRGLRSEPHACGPHYDLKRYAKASKEGRSEMKRMFAVVTAHLGGKERDERS